MPDKRYVKYQFGFLNTAQDQTDISDTESPNAINVDPDQLALGSLQRGNFDTLSLSPRDYLETTMGGRRFYLGEYSAYTTYDGSISPAYTEVPTTSDYAFASQSTFTLLFEFRYISGSGNMFGSGTTVANDGILGVNLSGGQIDLRYFDGTAPASGLFGFGYSDGQWHKLAIVSKVKNASTNTFQLLVDGVILLSQDRPNPSASISTAIQYLNDNSNAFACDYRNVTLLDFAATKVADWDGTIESIGVIDEADIVYSTPNGSFSDQFASDVLYGDVTTTYDHTKQIGPLRYETNPAGQTSVRKPHASITYTTNIQPGGVYSDEVNYAGDLLIAHDVLFSTIYTSNYIVASSFNDGTWGNTSGFVFSASVDANGVFTAEVTLGQYGVDPIVASLPIRKNTRVRFLILVRKLSSVSYRTDVVINGQLLHTDLSTSVPALYSVSSNVGFTNKGNATGAFECDTYAFLSGNFKQLAGAAFPLSRILQWSGAEDAFDDVVTQVFSTKEGRIFGNKQGITVNEFPFPSNSYFIESTKTETEIESPLVASNESPPSPDKPTRVSTAQYLDIFVAPDGGNTMDAITVDTQPGKGYIGPQELSFKVKVRWEGSSAALKVSFDYGTGQFGVEQNVNETYDGIAADTYELDNNLRINFPEQSVGIPVADDEIFEINVSSSSLLDGDYSYKLVGVKFTDTDPYVEIHSTPSEPVSISLKNLDEAGDRVANLVPVIKIPPAISARIDGMDRVDVYRKDPDSTDYVKIAENANAYAVEFLDTLLVSDLPRIEFLDEESDETFTKLNEAIGNSSGNYEKVFNKDNRLFLVPSDRKDLLLYSREGDWWGWRRENSFVFNGDITDVVVLRDTMALERTVTLVIFTTKGIYHITGEGNVASPYFVVPVVGTDDFTNLSVQPNSVINANGTIMLMSKSSDGAYDTGAYGQKIYEYDLQKVTEVSGRIRSNTLIEGTGNVSYANLIGGDKYVTKLDTKTDGLVYHRDARGWVAFDSDARWRWESKRFLTQQSSRTSPANAKAFKIDYEGNVTLTFIYQRLGGTTNQSVVNLSSGSRITMENVLPYGMGEGWQIALEGADANAIVHNFWFVQ